MGLNLWVERACNDSVVYLIDNEVMDFTVSQFDESVKYDNLPSNREEAFLDTNAQQYKRSLHQLVGKSPSTALFIRQTKKNPAK